MNLHKDGEIEKEVGAASPNAERALERLPDEARSGGAWFMPRRMIAGAPPRGAGPRLKPNASGSRSSSSIGPRLQARSVLRRGLHAGDRMRRREILIGALSALSVAAIRPAFAEPARRARMGWLSGGPARGPGAPVEILKDALQSLGWRIGETLDLEERHASGDPASLPRLAAELVAKRPEVIGATGGTEAKALQDATRDIPIVFMQVATDPVAAGLVDSITRPGGNVTGFLQSPELLWGKRLDLVKELLGHPPRRLAFVGSTGHTSFGAQWRNAYDEAGRIGAEIKRADVSTAADL